MELGLLCKSDLTLRNAGTVLSLDRKPTLLSITVLFRRGSTHLFAVFNLGAAFDKRQSEMSDFAEWYLNIYSSFDVVQSTLVSVQPVPLRRS